MTDEKPEIVLRKEWTPEEWAMFIKDALPILKPLYDEYHERLERIERQKAKRRFLRTVAALTFAGLSMTAGVLLINKSQQLAYLLILTPLTGVFAVIGKD